MKIEFTGRGIDISDRVRSFTESKLERFKKLLDDIHDVQVVLSVEKYRQKAEVKFLSNKKSFHGSEETNDMYQSLDRVLDKLDAQVRRFKEKMTAKKRNTTETIRSEDLIPPQVSEDPADTTVQVYKVDDAQVKPMRVDEAVEELSRLQHEFVVFRNSRTDVVNVVYRRKDGHINHIGPNA